MTACFLQSLDRRVFSHADSETTRRTGFFQQFPVRASMAVADSMCMELVKLIQRAFSGQFDALRGWRSPPWEVESLPQ